MTYSKEQLIEFSDRVAKAYSDLKWSTWVYSELLKKVDKDGLPIEKDGSIRLPDLPPIGR